jgi:hypothetical protein
VAPEILLAIADKRPSAQRVKVLADPAVQGTGIPAAVVVRVARAAVIRQTVDLACWFRFWVVTCTGVVAEEDRDIPSAAVMEELEEEVVERSIPLPAERV